MNSGLLHCFQVFYYLSPQGSPAPGRGIQTTPDVFLKSRNGDGTPEAKLHVSSDSLDLGKIEGKREGDSRVDEMVRLHHRLTVDFKFEQIPRDSEG